MIILAFLQNMWVKNPANVYKSLERNPDSWNRKVKSFLFMGCITGKRIKQVFGEKLANKIIYDETTKEIADNPKTIFKPDYEHIEETILKIKPDIVIAFGNHAYHAVRSSQEFINHHFKLIHAPHPAARQPDTIDKLKTVSAIITDDLLK